MLDGADSSDVRPVGFNPWSYDPCHTLISRLGGDPTAGMAELETRGTSSVGRKYNSHFFAQSLHWLSYPVFSLLNKGLYNVLLDEIAVTPPVKFPAAGWAVICVRIRLRFVFCGATDYWLWPWLQRIDGATWLPHGTHLGVTQHVAMINGWHTELNITDYSRDSVVGVQTRLRDGRYGVRIPVGARYSTRHQNVETGSGGHQPTVQCVLSRG
jgi:hypothetical protein